MQFEPFERCESFERSAACHKVIHSRRAPLRVLYSVGYPIAKTSDAETSSNTPYVILLGKSKAMVAP